MKIWKKIQGLSRTRKSPVYITMDDAAEAQTEAGRHFQHTVSVLVSCVTTASICFARLFTTYQQVHKYHSIGISQCKHKQIPTEMFSVTTYIKQRFGDNIYESDNNKTSLCQQSHGGFDSTNVFKHLFTKVMTMTYARGSAILTM